MLDPNASLIGKAIAVLLAWICCAVIVSSFMIPAGEVMKAVLIGLSPIIVAIVVLGATHLASRTRTKERSAER